MRLTAPCFVFTARCQATAGGDRRGGKGQYFIRRCQNTRSSKTTLRLFSGSTDESLQQVGETVLERVLSRPVTHALYTVICD